VAKELRRLGVKGILITAAELGYITEVKCGMRECFCPDQLGCASHFVSVTEYSDWNPTHEHSPIPKRDGAKEPSTTQSLRTGSATESTIREPLGGHTREISRELEKPPRANASRTPSPTSACVRALASREKEAPALKGSGKRGGNSRATKPRDTAASAEALESAKPAD
jgi:hypothetical protein